METTVTHSAAVEPRQTAGHHGSHAPAVGRDVHARLGGDRPNQDADLPPFWGEDGFTFDDLVDLVNPLHHIPLLGSLYRSLSGDQIAAGPRIMGGALFAGGPVGAVVAAAGNGVNASIAHETGKDVGGHVLAWMGIGDESGPDAPAPPPNADPIEVAEVSGLPWLPPRPSTNEPAQAAPPPVTATGETPVTETAAAATLATQPTDSRAPGTQMAKADQQDLSDHQWAMLVASLEPQEVSRSSVQSADVTDQPRQPADVAAAMVRALDKYEALTRARTLDQLAE